LAKHGFAQPTPVQAQAIVPALAGRDLVATAETGIGKTLAFVLPVIQRLERQPSPSGIRAVVLGPTRKLVLQIHGKRVFGPPLRWAASTSAMSSCRSWIKPIGCRVWASLPADHQGSTPPGRH
jgi:ATP-dependent RNA helicase RhlE